MPSNYPAGLDSLAKPTITTYEDDTGFEHDVVHTDVANAIEAVQATLGLNPQGASLTVAARLATLGTASVLNVPASGDAASGEVVKGNDSRLSDSRAPTGGAGGVLSGSYPNPGFAVDMATQAELDAVAAAKQDTISGTANEITKTGNVLSLPAALTFTGKTVTGGTFSGPTLSGTVAGTPTISGAWVYSSTLVVGASIQNGFVGGGSITPSLQVEATSADGIMSARWSNGSTGGYVLFAKSRGASVGTHTVVQSSDVLGSIAWNGSDGTQFREAAIIRCEVDGTPGSNDMPGRLVFYVTPDGSGTPAEALRLANDKTATLAGAVVCSSTLTTAAQLTVSYASATLQVGNGSGAPNLYINGAAGSEKAIRFRTNGSERWKFASDGVAEGGSNAGCGIYLEARDDAGSSIDKPIEIVRAAGGSITFGRPTTQATNWAQTGATTISTGTGAISLNGNVTVASGKTLTLGTALSVANGGTGATTAALARVAINQGSTALTDGANIATDASLNNVFTVTLGGNRTLDNPTNLVAGATYTWIITQDGTGSRTLAYGNKFKWPGGTVPVLSTAATSVDTISAVYDGTNLLSVVSLKFS